MAEIVRKIPVVINNLKKMGYQKQAGLEQIKTEIIREMEMTREAKIINALNIMVRLGYIREAGSGSIFYLYQSRPYDFPQEKEKIEEEIENKYGI